MLMDAGQIYGRGISFPPRLGPDGRFAWSEGEDNVREAIRVILSTELGERLNTPDFGCGLGQSLFEPNTAATRSDLAQRIARALTLWEPRVSVDTVAVDPDPSDPQAAVATISFRLVATGARGRVSLNVTLGS
jgi:phage baseplate assembly protein W